MATKKFKKFVVAGEQDVAFYNRMFNLWEQWRKRALDPKIVLPGLQKLGDGEEIIFVDEKKSVSDWLFIILARERQYHKNFFGQEFDLTEFEQKLRFYGRERVKAWQNLGLEPHFLPAVSLTSGDDYPGWKIKPGEWFFKNLVEGNLFRNINGRMTKMTTAGLDGISVLIDTRLKPAFNNGRQMYEYDNLLGPILERLRKENRIARYDEGPQSSRFGVSSDEWEEVIKPALAGKLGLDASQLRLESVEEGNVIPQLYPDLPRQNDGQTNTWVWYEQYLGGGRDYRLGGGRSGRGGLAAVSYDSFDGHWRSGSFRPLAVL